MPGSLSPALSRARALHPRARARGRYPVMRHYSTRGFSFSAALRFAGHPFRLRVACSLRCAATFNRTKALLNAAGRKGRARTRARAAKGLARRASEGRAHLRAQACSVHAPRTCAPHKAMKLSVLASLGR